MTEQEVKKMTEQEVKKMAENLSDYKKVFSELEERCSPESRLPNSSRKKSKRF